MIWIGRSSGFVRRRYLGDLYDFVQRPTVTSRAQLTRSHEEIVALDELEGEIPSQLRISPAGGSDQPF